MAEVVPDIASELKNGYLAQYVVVEVIHVYSQDPRTGYITAQDSAISENAVVDIDRVAKYLVACANARGKGAYITPLNEYNVTVTVDGDPRVNCIYAATMMMTDNEATKFNTVEDLIKTI